MTEQYPFPMKVNLVDVKNALSDRDIDESIKPHYPATLSETTPVIKGRLETITKFKAFHKMTSTALWGVGMPIWKYRLSHLWAELQAEARNLVIAEGMLNPPAEQQLARLPRREEEEKKGWLENFGRRFFGK